MVFSTIHNKLFGNEKNIMESLSNAQKKQLKSLAHSLNPVVMIEQHGLKETIEKEITSALTFHQLIKIKVCTGDRNVRDNLVQKIVTDNNAELIQRIGNIAVLYKRNVKKPNIL